uniref:Nucleoporin NUP42 n=1 Tax=Xenopus tropicalis TaxID=8364 RepID=F7ENF2_XENTR
MAEGQVQSVKVPPVNEDGVTCSQEKFHRQQPQHLCKFFSQGRYCRFGNRCRFLHQLAECQNSEKNRKQNVSCKLTEKSNATAISCSPNNSFSDPVKKGLGSHQRKYQPRKLCRYFASGFCAMENHCKFWHPDNHPPINDGHPQDKKAAATSTVVRMPVERPQALPESLRFGDVTLDMAKKLRETEISQLLKRFPKDKVIVQEREDGEVTYYRVTVEPTDPDWVFTVQIPEDQDLPPVMCRHVREASLTWLEAKHATNQLIGKVELLFRPYLHWLDRNMERLFTEGARLLKRDVDAEKAGIEFVPYQQLQALVIESSCDKSARETVTQNNPEDPPDESLEEDSDDWTSCDDDDDDDELEPGPDDRMKSIEGGGTEAPKKGTEIRFLGLKLGEDVGTLMAHCISVSLQCNRCQTIADLSVSGRQPCTAQCDRCNSRISGAFHPRVIHQFSAVLGYVDIQGASPKDLILQDCDFIFSCLSCSQEGQVQSLSYGIPKDLNCLHCHCKLSISVEATKFQKVERCPAKIIGSKGLLNQGRKRAVKDPSIQPGKPLPDHGTCRHYRKSCRWLRFPCCGKAYPCDVCHDDAEDHEMELASRMICGYCAKEQAYTNGKPCTSCGNMMSKGLHSGHWEGGRGCRNKVKMSRKDKQKYANSSKTVSRRSVSKF